MIEIKHLIKTYKNDSVETKVLRDISLSIATGQMIAIIGPSGAGKSTLLYQMSLLDHPTSGTVFINDLDINSISSQQRTAYRLSSLGYVFQDYSLLPELTAQENVALPLFMQGLSKPDALDRARIALERIGLGERLSNHPSQLSGGEQQRVGIARAIVNEPHIIFADEPTANLDSASSREVIAVLLDINKRGQTVVMVTHEMEYAQLCHRIVELRDGSIVSDTKTQRV